MAAGLVIAVVALASACATTPNDRTYDIAILGGRVMDPETGFDAVTNVGIADGRIVAITEDGRGYAWHQINACGKEVFDGKPAPEGCPPAPERTQ